MKITTFVEEVGAPNYKQVAKKVMAKFNGLTKPQATDIAKQVIEYSHKKKGRHPLETLEGIRTAMNDTLESFQLPIYLEAA